MKNAKDIFEAIADHITTANPKIRERVIEGRVEKVLEERAGILDKALEKAETMRKDLNKLKQYDQKDYDDNFNAVSGTYSEGRVKELKKLKENAGKLDAAIGKAINDGDYDSLKKQCK